MAPHVAAISNLKLVIIHSVPKTALLIDQPTPTSFCNRRSDTNGVVAVWGSASAKRMLGNGFRSNMSMNRERCRGDSALLWAALQMLDMGFRLHEFAELGSGMPRRRGTTLGTKAGTYVLRVHFAIFGRDDYDLCQRRWFR